MTEALSPIIRLGTRAVSPFAIIVGLYLLFAGHNNPGGGFAAGLVFGAVLALRTIAGFQSSGNGLTLLAAGAVISAGVALMPLAWGDLLFDQQVISTELPLLGKVKTGSALVFDFGVAAIVVGTVVAVLDGLGVAEFAVNQTTKPDPEAATATNPVPDPEPRKETESKLAGHLSDDPDIRDTKS